MVGRRDLAFAQVQDIMAEVDHLLTVGYATVGKWSLAQICNHLTSIFIWSVEGYPVRMPWLFQVSVGRVLKAVTFRTGRMKSGVPLPKSLEPAPDLDDRAEAEALRAAIGQYLASSPKRAPNPLLGRMKPEEVDRLHCIHAAHHLGFAIPNGSSSPARTSAN